jgi:TPR repeat protein
MTSKITSGACAVAAAVIAVTVSHGGVAMAATAPAAAESTASTGDQLTPEERLKRNQVSADTGVGDGEFRKEQDKALNSRDGDAALRVAQMFKSGSNGVPRDDKRMLQWLLHASSLNNGAASYQLYLHYLDLRLDRDAVFFENRAIEQGYTPPPRLDPRRG